MDALYFLRHSRSDDLEIRYSLRALARHLPGVRKVWVFGDRPAFLSDDTALVEHVPHEYVARVGNFRTPVTNFFLMFWLSSLIPELDNEFLWFCDDFILLDDLSEDDAKQARVVEDLSRTKNRGRGLWKDSLWRTYDLLRRLGYSGWNFETHVPTFFTKKRVLEAYCDFRDFVTEDRWYGPLGPTAILNHAYRTEQMPLVRLADEGRKIGFYGKPPSYEEVVEQCRGKTFLNFDDDAFGEGLRRYLHERFPDPSPYERPADEAPSEPATRRFSIRTSTFVVAANGESPALPGS